MIFTQNSVCHWLAEMEELVLKPYVSQRRDYGSGPWPPWDWSGYNKMDLIGGRKGEECRETLVYRQANLLRILPSLLRQEG